MTDIPFQRIADEIDAEVAWIAYGPASWIANPWLVVPERRLTRMAWAVRAIYPRPDTQWRPTDAELAELLRLGRISAAMDWTWGECMRLYRQGLLDA